MPRNKKIIWTDGLKGVKTATNPKGGGRVRGRVYAHLVSFPGIQNEQRMAWSRMKAQAKFREKQGRAGEAWALTWEEFLDIWDKKWHLRGTSKESYVLTKINQEGSWSLDNVEVCPRLEQWRRQVKTPSSNLGKKYRPRKSKV
jgi:hypothetical protein